MTLADLRTLIASRRNFATEHQLSPTDYDTLKLKLQTRGELTTSPNLRKEHFLFEGVVVVRSWEP